MFLIDILQDCAKFLKGVYKQHPFSLRRVSFLPLSFSSLLQTSSGNLVYHVFRPNQHPSLKKAYRSIDFHQIPSSHLDHQSHLALITFALLFSSLLRLSQKAEILHIFAAKEERSFGDSHCLDSSSHLRCYLMGLYSLAQVQLLQVCYRRHADVVTVNLNHSYLSKAFWYNQLCFIHLLSPSHHQLALTPSSIQSLFYEYFQEG